MTQNISIRKDWKLIQSLIDIDSSVLDIGCGEGELMSQLEKNLNSNTRGMEIDGDLVNKAINNGLNVIHGNAEKNLEYYSTQSFDYVILSQTLQAMYNPKIVLEELLRIGSKAIVSFPNFGHWYIRLQLLFNGKMPVTKGLPYSWYETPNIHFFTLKDFQDICKKLNINIEKSFGLTNKGKQFEITDYSITSNLITQEAIFLLSKNKIETIKIESKQNVFMSQKILANNQ
ncbi:MAG: hypothetical protein CFH19_00012 [Alphaproteobacteria bacterium MarineAlpha5_Bin9]|nr:MAG: hypothetical protein CFH19_00012 [Alphaproteobacteria bacterium MarineAlpha5_Bin9]